MFEIKLKKKYFIIFILLMKVKVICGDDKEQIGKLLSLDQGSCIVEIHDADYSHSNVKMYQMNQLCKLGTDFR